MGDTRRERVELKFKDGNSLEVNTLGELIDAVHDNTMLCIASHSSCLFNGPKRWFVRDVDAIEKHYGWQGCIRGDGAFKPLRDRRITAHRIRKLPGEPRMLMVEIEGRENGDLWLLSEYAPTVEKYWRRYKPRHSRGQTVKA